MKLDGVSPALARGWRQSANGGLHLKRKHHVAVIRPARDGPGLSVMLLLRGSCLTLEDALMDALEALERLERS